MIIRYNFGRDNETTSQLVLEARNGENLIPKDRGGTSDPYLVFGIVDANGKWIGKQVKTEVCKATLNPYFWESDTYEPVPDHATAFKVECWDHNAIGSDEFMGQSVVPLTDLHVFDATHDIWVELKPRTKEKVAGHIRMQYKYMTENYRKTLIEDRKASEAAEVELLRSLAIGIEQHCDISLIKEVSQHFAFVTKSGHLSNWQEITDFFIRLKQIEELYEIFGLCSRWGGCTSAAWITYRQPEVTEVVKANVMRFMDVDNDGRISWNELLRALPLLSSYDDNKAIGRRLFLLFDYGRKGELQFEGVMRVIKDRLFIAASILCLEIYSVFKIDKSMKKALKNDQATQVIHDTVMQEFEKLDGHKKGAEALWTHFNKEHSASITMDEFVDFYEANTWDVERCSESQIDELREVALESCKNALGKSK